MTVGLNSLEELQKCRQVCQFWNTMTSKMIKRKKVNIERKADCLAARIRKESEAFDFRTLPDILSSAILAHHGILSSVENIVLKNIDLEAVPIKHMALLVSCVIDYVEIDNVKVGQLTSLLWCPNISIQIDTKLKSEAKSQISAVNRSDWINP